MNDAELVLEKVKYISRSIEYKQTRSVKPLKAKIQLETPVVIRWFSRLDHSQKKLT